jgi:hypothetical protein
VSEPNYIWKNDIAHFVQELTALLEETQDAQVYIQRSCTA